MEMNDLLSIYHFLFSDAIKHVQLRNTAKNANIPLPTPCKHPAILEVLIRSFLTSLLDGAE
jgi:hypothetical protein